MIIKCINNSRNRDISIDKLYPVFSGEYIVVNNNKNFKSFRIIDDFGGVSIYEESDFEITCSNLQNYNCEKVDSIVGFTHENIDYRSFLENYYNDDDIALKKLKEALVIIYSADCSNKELVSYIVSNPLPIDDQLIILQAISSKMNESTASELVNHYSPFLLEADNELVEMLFRLLSNCKSDEVYDLFLKYYSITVGNNQDIDDIVIRYMDAYYQ